MLDSIQSEEDASFLLVICLITFLNVFRESVKPAPKLSENTTTTVKNKNTLLTSFVFLCLAEYSQLQQAKKKKRKKKVPFRRFSLDSACGC